MSYETLLTNIIKKVAIITLNRPKALNALNSKLMSELSQAIDTFESDEKIGAIIITGNEKAFAAGADIKEMQSKKYIDVFLDKNVKYIKWNQEKIRHFQTIDIGFWSKLHHVLTRDLIKKIKS